MAGKRTQPTLHSAGLQNTAAWHGGWLNTHKAHGPAGWTCELCSCVALCSVYSAGQNVTPAIQREIQEGKRERREGEEGQRRTTSHDKQNQTEERGPLFMTLHMLRGGCKCRSQSQCVLCSAWPLTNRLHSGRSRLWTWATSQFASNTHGPTEPPHPTFRRHASRGTGSPGCEQEVDDTSSQWESICAWIWF